MVYLLPDWSEPTFHGFEAHGPLGSLSGLVKLAVSSIFPILVEIFWLLILAFFCTVLLYLLHISVLKRLSAFTVGLAGNLEPIYGILLAVIFFGEAHDFTLSFYIGMTLILLSVFLQSILKKQAIAKW